MTRQQRVAKRRNRISLWRKVVGARPAWLVTLFLTILGGVGSEWLAIRDRIKSLESDVTHASATTNAETERLRRMILRRCEPCKT